MLKPGTTDEHVCDGCGTELGNGSLLLALVVTDIDFETDAVVHYHLCRDRQEPADGDEAAEPRKIKGCADRVIKKTTLKYRYDIVPNGRSDE